MDITASHIPDRELSADEIDAFLRSRFPGVDRRMDRVHLGGPSHYYLVLITLLPTRHVYRDGIVPHELTGDASRLEWWQRDNHLVGWGLAPTLGAATDQAIASARRGSLERKDITTWRDRIANCFRWFHRCGGQRWSSTGFYRPVGGEVSIETMQMVSALAD
jgi:hypothetical protein